MSNFLVTGGAGFIGSSLVRGLIARGAKRVVVLDNFVTGHRSNLNEVRGPLDLVEADIRNFDAITPHFRGIDVVFHEAAIPSVPRSIKDPVPSHECNVNGTFNVLRAAADAGVRRAVYAASSSAYGDTAVLPKVETMTPCPLSPYAAQKLMGEHYMSVWASCFGIETISLRYFNVFGPRQDPGSPYSGVLSLFITAVLERRTPTIFGDGQHSRDFTYVDDVVGLNIKAAEAPASVSGKMFNAGNGGRITIQQCWDLLQKFEGVSLPPKYEPARPGDVRDSQADTTAAVSQLGHAPQFSFEEGLRLTLEWYRSRRV